VEVRELRPLISLYGGEDKSDGDWEAILSAAAEVFHPSRHNLESEGKIQVVDAIEDENLCHR